MPPPASTPALPPTWRPASSPRWPPFTAATCKHYMYAPVNAANHWFVFYRSPPPDQPCRDAKEHPFRHVICVWLFSFVDPSHDATHDDERACCEMGIEQGAMIATGRPADLTGKADAGRMPTRMPTPFPRIRAAGPIGIRGHVRRTATTSPTERTELSCRPALASAGNGAGCRRGLSTWA